MLPNYLLRIEWAALPTYNILKVNVDGFIKAMFMNLKIIPVKVNISNSIFKIPITSFPLKDTVLQV